MGTHVVWVCLFFFSLPTAADEQHFWKQLLAGSLSGRNRQFLISPAVDSRSDAGWGVGVGGYGRGCTAGSLKAKERGGENGRRREGSCALLTWK